MRKTKKVLSVILACITIFGTSVTAFAADESVDTNENIEIVNLSQNIDENKLQKIKDDIVVKMVTKDGAELPVTATVTIEDISTASSARTYSSSENNKYQVTVTAIADTMNVNAGNNSRATDTNHDSAYKDGVQAMITLKLVWSDLVGTGNYFETISGTCTVTSGTVKKATLGYGNWIPSTAYVTKDVTGKSSFCYSIRKKMSDPGAYYSVDFKNAAVNLYTYVSASMFQ